MKNDNEDKLFDLVEQTEALGIVLEKYDETREDLEDIHCDWCRSICKEALCGCIGVDLSPYSGILL